MRIKITCMVLILTALIIGTSHATIYLGVENKSYSPERTFDDDIFLAGNTIRFQSQINGDLIGGCQELVFSGICQGNINWASRKLTINGPVNGSIRGFAQHIDINAPVGRNLMAFGQTITIGPATYIHRDATLFGEEIVFQGTVGNYARFGGDKVTIAGKFGGDLKIEAKEIEIEPVTVIEGDLIYESPYRVKIEDSVIIKGETRWIEIDQETEKEAYDAFAPVKFMLMMFLSLNCLISIIVFLIAMIPGNAVMIPLMFLTLIVSGIILVSLNRKLALKTVTVIKDRFLVALGLGILLILLFPFVSLLAILTVIGIPIGIIIIFAFGIFCFAGVVYSALFVGTYVGRLLNISKQPPSILCLIIGIIILGCLILIPVMGWIIAVLILAVGLGALVLSIDRAKVQINAEGKPERISANPEKN